MSKIDAGCNPHPDAPHGFNRNASHSEDRYVCECEGWEPPPKVYTEAQLQAAVQQERERCRNICLEEKVDAEDTGETDDYAYNTACVHCADAIRKERI